MSQFEALMIQYIKGRKICIKKLLKYESTPRQDESAHSRYVSTQSHGVSTHRGQNCLVKK